MLRGVLFLSIFASVGHTNDLIDKSFAPPSSIQPLAEPAQPDLGPTETIHTSYRNETIVADSLSIAFTLAIYADPHGNHSNIVLPMFGIGLVGVLATPVIHGVHGHGMRAVASYLLRSGLIATSTVLAVETTTCHPDIDFLCGYERVPASIAIGVAIAGTIDALALTDETEERPIRAGHQWTPILQPQVGGASLGVAARF